MRYLTLLLLLLLPGCDGGASYDLNPQNRPPDPAPIVGTWRVRSVYSQNTGTVNCPATTPFFSCTDNARLAFTQSGQFTDSQGTVRSYTLNGSALDYFGKPVATHINATFTGSLMTWEITDGAAAYQLLMERIN